MALATAMAITAVDGPFRVAPFPTSTGLVVHVCINHVDGSEKPVDDLVDLVETCVKWGEDHMPTTVWLDVGRLALLPFVEKVAACLIGSGIGLYVSCEGMSSHPPGLLLPKRTCRIMVLTGHEGTVWHGLARQYVPANPTTLEHAENSS